MPNQFEFSLSGLPALLLTLAVTVIPVMLSAKWVGARRNGFLFSLAAVFLGGFAYTLVMLLLSPSLLSLPLAFVAMFAVYAAVLGTSFPGAVGVAVVAFLLQLLIAFILMSLGLHVIGQPAFMGRGPVI